MGIMAENLPQVEYMVAMGIRNGWVDPHRGWGGVMWCRKKIMQSMMLSSGAAVFLEGSSLGLRKIARKAQDIQKSPLRNECHGAEQGRDPEPGRNHVFFAIL